MKTPAIAGEETEPLRSGSGIAQQTLRTYGIALDTSFKIKGRGRPKVKRLKDALPSLEYTTRGFRIKDARLCLPGKVTVPVVWSRELPCKATSVRVYRDNLGHWYASFVVRRDFECGSCGHTDCRGRNAARTILATAERVRASADDVRHSIVSLRDGGSGAVRAGNPPGSSVGNR